MRPREELFCREYLTDLNPVQAALRAGYSRGTAEEAYRWIKKGDSREKPGVRARVEALMAQRARRTGINADRVIRELARLGLSRITDIVNPATGALRDGISEDDAAAIAGMRVKRGADFEEYEVRLWDKNKSLELLGKHLGIFAERVQVEGGVPVIIDDSGAPPETEQGEHDPD